MNNPDLHKFLLECDCVGNCNYLVIERWNDIERWGDEDEFYADIYQVPRRWTLRYRIQNAWRSLNGQPIYDPGMVIEREQAEKLRDWLTKELT